jgi:tetratricopeptide (TPR) repeat protein
MQDRVRTAPGDVNARGQLASLQMELFLLDDAEANFREVLRAAPSLAAAHYNLGLVLVRHQREREAIESLERAIAGGLAIAPAWNNLGLAFKKTLDVDEATRAFTEALRADPRHWHAAVNLGRMHLATGDLGAAQSAFQEALRRVADPGQRDLIDRYLERVEQSR